MSRDTFKHDPTAEEWVDPYPKKKRHWLGWIVVPLLLVVFYVLSFGPAARLKYQKIISPNTMAKLYTPLLIAGSFQPFGEFLFWYAGLWKPKPSES